MSIVQRLAAQVGTGLARREWMLVTAETFTGGLLANVVASVRHSTVWFDRGFVTLSGRALHDMLGVRVELLSVDGPVSEAVASEMAKGALVKSTAQVSIALTGVDLLDHETPRNPLGTVHLAWARRGTEPESQSIRIDGDREMIRQGAIIASLQGILSRLS